MFFLSLKNAVLDGEIACLDRNGCSQFNHLLLRRKEPTFCVFDLVTLNGRDLRDLPLIERKRRLRSIVPECPQLLFVDYVEERGEEMFELICKRDLEGIVAKRRLSHYTVENGNPAWIKIRNRGYSQMIGRDELFERQHEARGAPEFGWNACAKAAGSAAIKSMGRRTLNPLHKRKAALFRMRPRLALHRKPLSDRLGSPSVLNCSDSRLFQYRKRYLTIHLGFSSSCRSQK
jgi:hypothetical protein